MSIRHYIDKIILLSWRLHKVQWNRPCELLWIIFAPFLLCFIAVGVHMKDRPTQKFTTHHDSINLDEAWFTLFDTLSNRLMRLNETSQKNVFIPDLSLGWAPKEYQFFTKVMEMSTKKLSPLTIVEFLDCPELQKAMVKKHLFAGICFDRSQYEKEYSFTGDHISKDEIILPLNYTIMLPSELRIYEYTYIGDHWKTIYHSDPRMALVKRLTDPSSDGHLPYVREGFVKIQKTISEAYLKIVSPKDIPHIALRRFPVRSPMMNYIYHSLPLLMIFGFLFPAQILVSQVVAEKHSQMRIFLINMNIGNVVHFVSWFFKGFIYMFISTILVVVLLKVQWVGNINIFWQTPWYIIMLVLWGYNMAAISFSLLVASFFKSTALALRVLTVLWVVSLMPFYIILNNREKINVVVMHIACAFPNTLLGLLVESLMERELFWEKTWVDQGYALCGSERILVYRGAIIFTISTIVYSAFGLYMDVWHMGETGGRRRKQVPSTTGHSGDFTYQERDDSFMPQATKPIGIKTTKIYEVEPSHRRFKIKIKKLCKRYGSNGRGVLNSFSWNVYENEVTVLMGHNGCGKTTLLKILAGLTEPTRGLVTIADYNIQTERHDASMQIGLALNNDLLCRDFTVMDQIKYICMVKGASFKDSLDEINLYLQLLDLTACKYIKIKNLSARERVLLNICCAFVGGSTVVLIDDIHSDLDLASQNLICNLINEEKSRRTILLVSSSTALAGHLADRLAIMSNGELKCTGSKPFLRNMYGHGYRLTCVKGDKYDLGELQRLLHRYIPNLTVESNIGYKVTFVLETKFEEKFVGMLEDLEEEMDKLGIISFRLRDTSLDEIFFRFGSEDGDMSGESGIFIDDLKLVFEDADAYGRLKGCQLTCMRILALFYMRLILNKRQITMKIIYGLALLFATVSAFSSILFYGKYYELVPLSYNLTQMHNIEAFVEVMSEDPAVNKMQEFYVELLFWYDGHVMKLKTQDVSEFYLLTQSEMVRNVNLRYIFGASFDDNFVTAWFNSIPLHGVPFVLNLLHNVVARRFSTEEASIDVTLMPLPFATSVNSQPQQPYSLGFMMALNFTVIFSNLWLGVVISSIVEKTFKKQQFLTGVPLHVYCFCLFMFDVVRIIVVASLLVSLFTFFLSPRHDFDLYVWIFLAFSLSAISVVSLWYQLSSTPIGPNIAFIIVAFINILGFLLFTIVSKDDISNINDYFQLFTQYTFCEMIFKLMHIYEQKWLCEDPKIRFMSINIERCTKTPNCCNDYQYWKGNYGLPFDCIMLMISILIPLTIFISLEFWSHVYVRRKLTKPKKEYLGYNQPPEKDVSNYLVDESVHNEKVRISNMFAEDYKSSAAVCKDVKKSYYKGPVIKQLDLAIARSECVALMGFNNAGKTTLIRMLVADTFPNSGEIWIGGFKLKTQRFRCYPLLGYCSQNATLPKDFTPMELVLIQARLLGIPKKFARPICDGLAHLLGFQSCARLPLGFCTIGQTRRIAFALAIMGDPRLICVDGAPGFIDPNGRRTMHTMTSYMQTRGSSFIYTNLCGLDCERICQRTLILYNGELWTMGDRSNRYKRGYYLEVRFKRKANADVTTARATWDRINQFPVSPHNKLVLFVQIKFPEAVLMVKHDNTMAFYIPYNSISFSEIFLTIRKDAFELNVEDFFITRNWTGSIQMELFDSSPLKDR